MSSLSIRLNQQSTWLVKYLVNCTLNSKGACLCVCVCDVSSGLCRICQLRTCSRLKLSSITYRLVNGLITN